MPTSMVSVPSGLRRARRAYAPLPMTPHDRAVQAGYRRATLRSVLIAHTRPVSSASWARRLRAGQHPQARSAPAGVPALAGAASHGGDSTHGLPRTVVLLAGTRRGPLVFGALAFGFAVAIAAATGLGHLMGDRGPQLPALPYVLVDGGAR